MAMQTREKVRRLPTRKKMRPPLRKGVYLLPNLFTTGGLFCGFYASVTTLQGEFRVAATAILIALIFDSLDGRIARMTKTSSRFGAEYDSLSDLGGFWCGPRFAGLSLGTRAVGRVGLVGGSLIRGVWRSPLGPLQCPNRSGG